MYRQTKFCEFFSPPAQASNYILIATEAKYYIQTCIQESEDSELIFFLVGCSQNYGVKQKRSKNE